MGEAEEKQLYERATAEAWNKVEQQLGQFAAAQPGKKLELTKVEYDPFVDESLIEELPDQPKSSRPQAVEVAVHLRVTYEVH